MNYRNHEDRQLFGTPGIVSLLIIIGFILYFFFA